MLTSPYTCNHNCNINTYNQGQKSYYVTLNYILHYMKLCLL